jgi:hypothetical protein
MSANEKTGKKTLNIPKAQVFDPAGLLAMFNRLSTTGSV